MDSSYILLGVLLFVAMVLGLEGLYQVWASKNSAEAKRVAARLRSIDDIDIESPLTLERLGGQGRWQWIDMRLLPVMPGGEALRRHVTIAGVGCNAGELLVFSVLLALAGFLLPLLLYKPMLFSIAGALALGSLPWLWLSRKRQQRIVAFEKQIPLALDLMGRAMRAGHAFPTAVKMVGDEMPAPLGPEFRQLADETNYGIPQQEALLRLAERVPIPDLNYFVVAVIIQRESGGNLAELLDNIATIVRARLKLFGQVRTLSAEGRLSAIILIALPFATAGLINLISPGFMTILWTDPAGQKLVGAALVSMLLGALWMRKIIRIRV